MKAVIYARYSSDSQREESIEGSSVNVPPLPRKTESRYCGITSTARILQRPTTARSSRA